MSDLIIVESPEKGKTIKRFLGDGYKVVASKGHIRDLPKKTLSVDIENGFLPGYENIPEKAALIKELKKDAKASGTVYLATDPDREGEAISWHLAKALELPDSKIKRVTFNEITKSGVKQGMETPRDIDMDVVDAQQTRRILDRIVGYKLSPFLWTKVKKGLSAGRVQSVVVRLIVLREREIRDFVTREFWTVDAVLEKNGQSFKAKFYGDKNGEIKPETKEEADKIIAAVQNGVFTVDTLKRSARRRSPSAPFTTSTLQQDASKRLGMSTANTMRTAQKLYEGIEIEGLGETGLITYMRTDSLRISDEAAKEAEDYIKDRYGAEYLPEKRRTFKTKAKNVQDAHEAIRPTMPSLEPQKIKASLTSEQYKLYKLIWERFITSQMANCVMDTVSADIVSEGYVFRCSGSSVKFDGFTILYDNDDESAEQAVAVLKDLKEGDKPGLVEITPNQHFTQPPPRYNEGSLVAAMEEEGIGRPSTYAPIISTVIAREYVEKEAKVFKPTILGEKVTELMEEQFPDIVNVKFTAEMENQLDEVSKGSLEMTKVLSEFYDGFDAALSAAKTAMEGIRIKLPDIESDEKCEKCGRTMVVKSGRFGKFLACPGYPECKSTKPYQEKCDGLCPECGKPMVLRQSAKGAKYYGCTGYPECKYLSWDEPLLEKCPKCGAPLFKKKGRWSKIYCAKEDCGYSRSAYQKKETDEDTESAPKE